jgi:hydroxyacylglutathione hydrolase
METKSYSFLRMRLGFTNSYLLKGSKGYIMIDTSYPSQYERFLRKLRKAHIRISDINYLLLTHHHDDHAGFANRLLEKSEVKLIVHKNALPFLKKGQHHKKGEHFNWWVHAVISLFSGFLSHGYPSLNVHKDDIVIEDGNTEILKDLGIDGKILHTPGHSIDSISVLLTNGNAFVGDAAMNFLNLGRTQYRPFFIQNIGDVFKSWRLLIEAGAEKIYPSHGKPFNADELIRNLGDESVHSIRIS